MDAKKLFGSVLTILVAIVSTLVLINLEPVTIFKNNPISGVQGWVFEDDWHEFCNYDFRYTDSWCMNFLSIVTKNLGDTNHAHYFREERFSAHQDESGCYIEQHLVVIDEKPKQMERVNKVTFHFATLKFQVFKGNYFNLFWKTKHYDRTLIYQYLPQTTVDQCKNGPNADDFIEMFIQTVP